MKRIFLGLFVAALGLTVPSTARADHGHHSRHYQPSYPSHPGQHLGQAVHRVHDALHGHRHHRPAELYYGPAPRHAPPSYSPAYQVPAPVYAAPGSYRPRPYDY